MEAELRSILGDMPRVAEIAHGFTAVCGPAFTRRGYLLFCDAGASRIWKCQAGEVSLFRSSSRGARSLTFDHQGRLLACEGDGVTRTEKDGSFTALIKQPQPADVVYAIDGNIYFCAGAHVYLLARDGRMMLASAECERPTGIALSPNQQVLYATDAGRDNVRAFRIDANGSLDKGRVFATPAASGLGGLKTDEAGRVWVAGSSGICVFSREGKSLGSVPIPGKPNNLNWAEGFGNLFVTTESSVYRLEARTNGTRTY